MPKTTRILHPEFALIQRKPLGAMRIKGKYLRMGLRGLWLMENGRFTNLVTGQAATSLGSGVTHSVRAGQLCAHTTSADAGNVIKIGNIADYGMLGASDITVLFKGDVDTASGNAEQSIFGVYEGGTRFYLRQDNVNNNIDMWVTVDTSRQYPCPATLSTWYDAGWKLNEIHTIGVRWSDSRGQCDWFEDGINHGGPTVDHGPVSSSGNTQELSIGGRDGGNLDNWQGNIYWCALFVGSYVPESVLLEVTRSGSPAEFLEPDIPIIIPKAPTVAGVTVDVPLASYTLTSQVPTVAAGAAVDVPQATYTVTGQVPTVAAGASVSVPIRSYLLFTYVPTVTAGASVAVPLATYTVTGQIPTIEAGGGATVAVPLATYTVTGQVPTVAAGASVAVPLAAYTITGHIPTLQIGGVTVDVPLSTYTLTGQVPAVAAGAATAVPLATYTATGQVPTIETVTPVNIAVPLASYTLTAYVPTAGIPIEEFPVVPTETDADRSSVMFFDSATLIYGGTPYRVIAAETDGLTLDSGTDVDGVIEVQMLTSDIVAGAIPEHATVVLGGVSYTIGKIDGIGGGMSVLYLEP